MACCPRKSDDESGSDHDPSAARYLVRVTLRLRNSALYSREGYRGARNRHLTPMEQDIEEKFRLIATPVLGESNVDKQQSGL